MTFIRIVTRVMSKEKVEKEVYRESCSISAVASKTPRNVLQKETNVLPMVSNEKTSMRNVNVERSATKVTNLSVQCAVANDDISLF